MRPQASVGPKGLKLRAVESGGSKEVAFFGRISNTTTKRQARNSRLGQQTAHQRVCPLSNPSTTTYRALRDERYLPDTCRIRKRDFPGRRFHLCYIPRREHKETPSCCDRRRLLTIACTTSRLGHQQSKRVFDACRSLKFRVDFQFPQKCKVVHTESKI